MYKQSQKQDASGVYRQNVIAQYDTHGDRPWFGEMSLWNNKPRSATAICSVSLYVTHVTYVCNARSMNVWNACNARNFTQMSVT